MGRKKMKKILLTFALAIAMSVPAFAATTIGDWEGAEISNPQYAGTQADSAAAGLSANGLLYSRHNLSSYGEHYQATTSVSGTSTATGIEPLSVITTEVCVFCHTPHFGRADTATLWNRGSSATGYVAYGTTVGGTAITSVGGSSLACLSCHDGVTTLDNIINKPGKGSKTGGLGVDAGWVFSEVGNFIGDTSGTSDGLDATDANVVKAASRLNIGASNTGVRDAAAVDLSNDHPINVTYNAGTVASLRPTTTAMSDLTMDNARSNASDPTDSFGRSDNLWASRGFISNTVTIAEVLRDGGKVQCASCHDPHYKNQTNSDPAVVASYGADVEINDVDSDGL